ncbi:MAG: hypothetical protein LBS28_01170 [Streptococcaceae bacterium]|jgi:hypothetical protein|nr:hypothetical protein [Streptococcaceae bacterium]
MKRVFIGVIALMAFGFNCFAQKVIKADLTLNNEIKIDHTLNLNPSTEREIQIPISLKWEKTNEKDTVHITFNKVENEILYICLFSENLTFKDVKKTLSIKFEKNFRKKMKIDGDGKSVRKDSNDFTDKKAIIANLSEKDLSLSYANFNANFNADTAKLEFKLTAYIARESDSVFLFTRLKRYRTKIKILHKTDIPFNLTLINLCQSKELKDRISDLDAQIENISSENNSIREKTNNLSCKNLKNSSSITHKKTEVSPIAKYADCLEYKDKVSKLNDKIKEYNKVIEQYNRKLDSLKTQCNKQPSSSCDCDCNKLTELVDSVGPLYLKLSLGQIKDKNEARSKFKDIKKSLKCYDKCKECGDYQKFEEYCNKIEKLLK